MTPAVYSENVPAEGVALTPVRPRSVCEVRFRGLPGSASFWRLRKWSAWLQPPRQDARLVVIFIAFQRVGTLINGYHEIEISTPFTPT